jgi:AcrR family transcriptional regulator
LDVLALNHAWRYCQGVPTTAAKRPYDSTRRARQAAQTRAEVIDAAIDLFRDRGWSGTTLAAVAEEAGVSVETIYKGFGSKKALLREALDVAVAGDTEPIPIADRPEFLALDQGTTAERIAHGAALLTAMHGRTAGVWQSIVEAASSDPEIGEWRVELEQRRLLDVRRSVSRVLGRDIDEDTVAMLWVVYSSAAYHLLVHDRGLTPEQYEALLVDATTRIAAPHL